MLGVGVSQGLVRPKQFLGGHGTATSPELGGNFVGRAESRRCGVDGGWVGLSTRGQGPLSCLTRCCP